MTEKALDMIENLMILNPDKRWSALEALDADFFFENPMVKTADKLTMSFAVSSVHEWECRRKHEQMMAQRQASAASAAAAKAARP
jgi:cyclin-dependent kinase 12/13